MTRRLPAGTDFSVQTPVPRMLLVMSNVHWSEYGWNAGLSTAATAKGVALVTLTFCVPGKLLTATVPDTVVVPSEAVTTGLLEVFITVTGAEPAAAALWEFIIVPTIPSSTNTTAAINCFLNLIIGALLVVETCAMVLQRRSRVRCNDRGRTVWRQATCSSRSARIQASHTLYSLLGDRMIHNRPWLVLTILVGASAGLAQRGPIPQQLTFAPYHASGIYDVG